MKKYVKPTAELLPFDDEEKKCSKCDYAPVCATQVENHIMKSIDENNRSASASRETERPVNES